jgi:hypothetical protein
MPALDPTREVAQFDDYRAALRDLVQPKTRAELQRRPRRRRRKT